MRLLLFEDCNRQCKGCCNQYYDLKNLPVETDFTGYREVILTGGEPMLKPQLVLETIKEIRAQNPQARIFMYTAKVDNALATIMLLRVLDGVTVTLHETEDVASLAFFAGVDSIGVQTGSRRLNVFKGVYISEGFKRVLQRTWAINDNKVWMQGDCLPEGEVFKRLAKA